MDQLYSDLERHLLKQALDKAISISEELQVSLPDSFDPAACGVREKAPFQLLSVRESIIWRTEELARNACRAIAESDLTVAAILARAIIESTAVLWQLYRVIERDNRSDPQKSNDELMNVLAASRVYSEHKRSYQILNFVDLIDKTIPGTRKNYDDLSEIAHPNWQGVAGMYSTVDTNQHLVKFGRNKNLEVGRKIQIAVLLSEFLVLFKNKYNEISEVMPAWISKMSHI